MTRHRSTRRGGARLPLGLALVLALSLLASGIGVTGSPPVMRSAAASSAPHTTIDYFALGDSIASGYGLKDDGAGCRQSDHSSYPQLISQQLRQQYDTVRFTMLACSGASVTRPTITPTPTDDGQLNTDPNQPAMRITADGGRYLNRRQNLWLHNQVAYTLANLSDRPTLVTITIGINDFGWSDNETINLLLHLYDDEYRQEVERRTARMREALEPELASLVERPNVAVVVTDIPNPFNRDSQFWANLDRLSSLFHRDPNRRWTSCVTDPTQLGCYARADYAIDHLSRQLIDIVTDANRAERLRHAPVYEAFTGNGHGHESPQPACGRAGPTVAQTWIQYPGAPDSNAPIDSVLRFALGGTTEENGDCFHPNSEGARQIASLVLTRAAGLSYFAHPAIERTWSRADKPVADGLVHRTWMWGPRTNSGPILEAYAESPGGQRLVQYFDKSRMEVNDPNGDGRAEWFVTNGLLVRELMTGQLMTGDARFEQRSPALVNIAGDPNDPAAPTYATFGTLTGRPALSDGSVITQKVDRAGIVTNDPTLAQYGMSVVRVDTPTGHSVATVFWEFMHVVGLAYIDGRYQQAPLTESPLFAAGQPLTEPYWTTVRVAGVEQMVLVQVFERRVLTFTPSNPDRWKVEAGNVGQHYQRWRYGLE